ncbi:hypothetical protein K7P01_25225 [Fulvivirgaceae bacterium QH1ED-6-2]|jgi:hypothetical protein|nr:hypothetical protein [Parachryseolinea silvisoli]
MKYVPTVLCMVVTLLIPPACESENTIPPYEAEHEANDLMKTPVKIKIRDRIFAATLVDNASVTHLTSMLPLTMSMTELNGNEKYFLLAEKLPTRATNPGTIHAGDLMLWGSNTLVVFYETFTTSYNYTKLGEIDNPTGLAAALGTGDVTVTIAFN